MKRNTLWRWLSSFVVLSMLLAMFPIVAMASPANDPIQPPETQATAPESITPQADDVPTLQQATAVAIQGQQLGLIDDGKGTTEKANYIVQFFDAPLASYRGEIAGLEATNPGMLGEIHLDATSPASHAYINYLERQHGQFLATVNRTLERSITPLFDYKYAFNGLALALTPEEAAYIATLPQVRMVAREQFEELTTDAGPAWIGAPNLWDGSATGQIALGEGVVAGIIDTGINFDHISFADVGPIDGYDHTNPLGPGNYLGVCDPTNTEQYDASYVCNDKLIGGYSFVDETVTPEDSDGHGSHTSSTVVGNFVTATMTPAYTYTTVLTEVLISGVAPHANIIMYDACIETCPGTALLAAADQIAADGIVDVVNYSIGGGLNPWADPVELAFLTLTDAGTYVSTSAGNDGVDTVEHNSPWVAATGASTHDRVFNYETSLFNMTGGDTTPPADAAGYGITGAYGPAAMVFAGDYGDPLCGTDFPAGTWSGEIVVCDRGSYALVDKANHVRAGGAGGVIIANTAAANGALYDDIAYSVPGMQIGLTDGDAVRTWLSSGTGHMGQIQLSTVAIDHDPLYADIMADFSSTGPNHSSDVIKPDLVAPGVSILAADMTTVEGPWDEFGLKQGTSMASPHDAGSAALMTSLYPTWTPSQIKSALMMTAWTDVVKPDGTTPADWHDMGAGRIQLTEASRIGMVLNETTENFENADPALGGDPRTLNLASMMNSQCLQECSWTRTFESVLGVATTYTVTVDVPAGMTLTVEPAVFTIAPYGTQTITVTADVSAMPVDEWQFANVLLDTDANHMAITPFELWSEGFESAVPPTGWATYNPDGGAANQGFWQGTTGTSGSHGDPHTGTYYAWHNDDDVIPDGPLTSWLVTPQFTAPTAASLTFWERNYYTSFAYEYHGVWISNGSCDPADGDFVELQEYPTVAATWTERTLDFSTAYAGQDVCLAFVFTGDYADEWYLDDVSVNGASLTDTGIPVSDLHLPVLVMPTAGVLPELVTIDTRRNTGSQLVEGFETVAIADLNVTALGLAPADLIDMTLPQDTNNADPYDDVNDPGVYYTLFEIPVDTYRMVLEIVASESSDIDLFFGYDSDGNGMPSEDEQLDSSATGAVLERIEWIDPIPSTDFWVMVVNYEASSVGASDPTTLAIGMVPYSDEGNLTFDAPASVAESTPFDINLFWDEPAMMAGDVWYGAFAIADGANDPIGIIPVDLYRHADDVTKTASTDTAYYGEVVTYTIAVQPNVTPNNLTYMLTDTIPAGLTYVPGSATATEGTVNVVGDELTWTGTLYTADPLYMVSTSDDDPNCDTGFGGYVNLQDFGILAQSGISGDTAAWTAFTGQLPFNFYGVDNTGIYFTDDGFAGFDIANNWIVAPEPWTNQNLPDPTAPNNLIAILWQDMEIVYDAGSNHGVSLATAGADTSVLEYDDVQVAGDPSQTYDVELVYHNGAPVDGVPEFVVAYDNIVGAVDASTVGVENPDGTTASLYAYNDAGINLHNGLMICYDWAIPSADPIEITYAVTVDESAASPLSNEVLHITDNPGDMEALTSVELTTLPSSHTLNINIVGMGEVTKVPSQTTYLYGDVVTLTATADPGWMFVDWSGDASGTANPLALTIMDDTVVTATFEAVPLLSITKELVGPMPVMPGDTITYVVTVANDGAAAANGVVISDTLPAGVTGADLDVTVDIAAGAEAVYNIPVTVSTDPMYSEQNINNTAYYYYELETGHDSAAFTVGTFNLYLPVIYQGYDPARWTTFTILHTNDFHGNLEPAGSNPGIARVAHVINNVRNQVGDANVLLFDAGDEMQGSLLSNLTHGEATIDLFNFLDYDAATPGNHEFDWGQTVLRDRIAQADYPFLAANLVVSNTGDCATAGWTSPDFTTPWMTMTVGAPGNEVVVGLIGVTTQETPYITVAEATQGLCFKDPTDSITHYYDDVVAAGAEVLVVLSHLGNADGGYGYGIQVYGDQTLARNLINAGKPVDLIIGGHSHTNLSAPQIITVSGKPGTTYVTQAYYAGRRVGRADITYDHDTDTVAINWHALAVSPSGDQDAATQTQLELWSNDPDYQALINTVIGYTKVDLIRRSTMDNMMGTFINDAIYNQLNNDAEPLNDADMVFNNSGGIRANIIATGAPTTPYTLTYGSLFSVLPFGNQTIVGDMTGAQIMELLNQSATLFKGTLQIAGIRFKYYSYGAPTTFDSYHSTWWAWGAYDVTVYNRDSSTWEPLVMTETYRVATNEFLAPAGQDGFTPFKYLTNISYWGDMLNQVIAWTEANNGTPATAYNGPNDDGMLDGRIERVGDNSSGPVIPVTILHHNDSHGHLLPSGSYPGYTNLVTLIRQEWTNNPGRTILLNAGDQIQGDAMMAFYKAAFTGYGADGTTLPITLTVNPMMAAMNALTYTAMTLGNHEYNYGGHIFTGTLGQANFPLLQANVYDDGQYGLAEVNVRPYVTVTVGGIDLAILGIGNHRIPNYELPSNIPGLTFTNPITEAQMRAPALDAAYDAVIALTHIGFTENPTSVEVDENVDTNLAAQTTGIDVIIGGHSHTNPATGFGAYKYLPAFVGAPDNTPVLINQAYRYNSYLGEVVLGMLPDGMGGYYVAARAGKDIAVTTSIPEDPAVKAILTPYNNFLTTYKTRVLGTTSVPLDAVNAYTQETNAANLQADASVDKLETELGIDVDFHLSGAMTNGHVADSATPTTPYTLTVNDMFTLMPYENSLLVMNINGAQLKAILERGYRNYWYYKYVTGYGGYSHYTTCMLDISAGGIITYTDPGAGTPPNGNNVVAMSFNDGTPVHFTADYTYTVSTVNYLAAGSCNFNDGGVSLWPLNQIAYDTQYYVRDVVIEYIPGQAQPIAPAIEGRLRFLAP